MQYQATSFPKASCIPHGPPINPSPCRLPKCEPSNHRNAVVCAQHPVGSSDLLKEETARLPALEHEQANELLDWDKCWYPVVVFADLEPKRPTPVKLLGRDFVLWRDVNKEWKCFEDACPHRLAPLSEGRIEPSDGSLMCSYHGWRFQSDGECTRIPQAKDGGVSTGCKHPRSRAKAFPVKIARQMVWVWPEDAPSAFVNSAMQEPNGIQHDYGVLSELGPLFMRDFELPFDVLMENAMDPSHADYLHHNGKGYNRDRAGWMESKNIEGSPEKMSFGFQNLLNPDQPPENHAIRDRRLHFSPPNYVEYARGASKLDGRIIVHFSPISHSRTRIFATVLFSKRMVSPILGLLLKISRPGWRSHLMTNRFFDGDISVLNQVASRLRDIESTGKSWKSEYFMPQSSEAAVIGFRRWLHEGLGGSGPKLPSGRALLGEKFTFKSREVLYDRYSSHTVHCKICTRALSNIKKLKNVTRGIVWLLVLKSFWTLFKLFRNAAGSISSCIAIAACTLAAAGVASALGRLEQSFKFVDYVHWR